MVEVGTVVKVGDGNRVTVEINRSTACDGCHARGACAMTFQNRLTTVEAIDTVGVEVGQRVALEISDNTFLAVCAIVYGIPLLLLLAGGVVGHVAANVFWGGGGGSGAGEGATAIGAFAGLGLGFLITRLVNRRIEQGGGAGVTGPGGGSACGDPGSSQGEAGGRGSRYQIRVRGVLP